MIDYMVFLSIQKYFKKTEEEFADLVIGSDDFGLTIDKEELLGKTVFTFDFVFEDDYKGVKIGVDHNSIIHDLHKYHKNRLNHFIRIYIKTETDKTNFTQALINFKKDFDKMLNDFYNNINNCKRVFKKNDSSITRSELAELFLNWDI